MERYLECFRPYKIVAKGQKLLINGSQYSVTRFRKNFKKLIPEDHPLRIEILGTAVSDEGIVDDLFYAMLDKYVSAPSTKRDSIFQMNTEHLVPVVDCETGQGYVINTLKNELSVVGYDAYMKAIPTGLKKAMQAEGLTMAKTYFDPYDGVRVKEDTIGGMKATFINKYLPPKWILKPELEVKECPEVFLDFMKHLFMDNKEQMSFVLDWLYLAAFKRAETMLVLNGDKGVGKNTLFEILQGVIGNRYCAIAPKSLGVSTFNAVLEDRRLILFDEYKFTREVHQTAKRLANEEQAIEKKGVDVGEPIKTFNSFMVFHNSVVDTYLEMDDRRFSVMDITNINLAEKFGVHWVEDLIADVRNPSSETVREIGWYIKQRGDRRDLEGKINPNTCFKGETFYTICDYHTPVWIRAVISMVEQGEINHFSGYCATFNEIEEVIQDRFSIGKSKYVRRLESIEKVLNKYRFEGRYKLGEVYKDSGNKNVLTIKISDDLLERFGQSRQTDNDIDIDDIDI